MNVNILKFSYDILIIYKFKIKKMNDNIFNLSKIL